jgi:NADPH2:quinone reductase
MKAIRCKAWGGPETLVVEDIELPPPGQGEVRIHVHAAGVNFPDLLMIQKKYQLQPPLPFTPGAEVAGDVLAVGEGVAHVKPGDRVASFCGLGGFAEEVNAPVAATLPLPNGMPYNIAAGFALAYGTSWHAVRDRANLQPNETMLVLGAAGGVGLAAVEIGKAVGARVIAAASSDEKLAVCREHGADGCINYAKEDLREAIKRECGKDGPNVIYDPVGGKFAEPAFRSIAWRGRYLVIGFADGDIPTLSMNLPLLKGASVVGVFWGSFTQREPHNNLNGMGELLRWLEAGRLKPRISATYALADVPRALHDVAARRVMGKAVIVP